MCYISTYIEAFIDFVFIIFYLKHIDKVWTLNFWIYIRLLNIFSFFFLIWKASFNIETDLRLEKRRSDQFFHRNCPLIFPVRVVLRVEVRVHDHLSEASARSRAASISRVVWKAATSWGFAVWHIRLLAPLKSDQ